MFDDVDDVKTFGDELANVMRTLNENDLYHELVNWREQFFTTQSEQFGQFKNILLRILEIEGLSKTIKIKIKKCIQMINKIFWSRKG